MIFTQEFILQIIVALSSAYAVYAGIREQIGKIGAQAKFAKESADQAHCRIDTILNRRESDR